ncbi:hypothetical protein HSBAA_36950 [Vreelandella sulfidaeris]|uniref:Uncharacterized protein n=1 Tax=Vreelandella sulfidaeris TaxID=115553 RepID=A0A455UDG5_9GAMM|nr:hypothetical protein HSBAA_36950 [Halomonas sulfidaeris]
MAAASIHYPWYKKEDTDAFFALFQNNIANFVIIAITMLGMGFPLLHCLWASVAGRGSRSNGR